MNDCVLLDPEPVKSYEETMGYKYVITPDKFRTGPIDPPVFGRVLSKGSLCSNSLIKRNSRIMVGKWAGAKFKWEGRDLMIVKEKDVLAVDGS